jgi:hypothetical protein
MNRFDAELKKSWFGLRTELMIGEDAQRYGDMRLYYGSHSYKAAEYFLQRDMTVVQWPYEAGPNEEIAHQVCNLLSVKRVRFVLLDGETDAFNFVESSALHVA